MALKVCITKNDVVEDIMRQKAESPGNLMVKYSKPYTVGLLRAEIGGKERIGMGVSKVCYPDKYDKRRGKITVTLRAARQIANDFIEELERDAVEANEAATDLGLTLMKIASSHGEGAEYSDLGQKLVDYIETLEKELDFSLANGEDKDK